MSPYIISLQTNAECLGFGASECYSSLFANLLSKATQLHDAACEGPSRAAEYACGIRLFQLQLYESKSAMHYLF